MRRSLAVLLSAILFALAAPAAPVPKHLMKGPVYYYPTTPGTKWVYRGGGEDFTLVVTKVEDRKAAKVVSVELVVGDRQRPYESVEVSTEGLIRTVTFHGKPDPPDVLLKVPFNTGDSWPFDHAGGSDERPRIKGTRDIAGVEKIAVLAGTFEAVRVDMSFPAVPGGKVERSKVRAWYAPNVGVVKLTGADGKEIWQLKSFTPGKE